MSTPTFIHDTNKELPLTSADRIFLGEGLFETLRISKGTPCYPKLHWQRLLQASASIGLTIELAFDDWLKQLRYCQQKAGFEDGGIKVLLSSGPAARGLLSIGQQPWLIFQAFEYQPESRPVKLSSAAWRRDASNPLYRIKSIDYLEAILARRQMDTKEGDDVLFFNMEDCAMETTIANLFLIKDHCVYTPPVSSGVLPGIIRGRILSQADSWGLVCEEQALTKTALAQAESLFICNVLQSIRPVQSWDGHRYDSQHPVLIKMQHCLEKDAGLSTNP